MSLTEVKVEIPFAAAEAVDNILLEQGVVNWSVLEDVIVKRAWIVGVFERETDAKAAWQMLRPLLPETPLAEPEFRTMADQDWRDSYKAHFKPWRFGRLHWVPIWEKDHFQLPTGDVVIWLDPGLAFGTGNHETTRLCVERLVALASRDGTNGRVLDAGCGSGILTLSAAKLGYRDVVGFDNDPEAVRVSEENAALNGLSGEVTFFTGDLISGLAGRTAEIVLANIQADVLMRFAASLLRSVAPGGTLVMSGILAAEIDSVRSAFTARALGWSSESRLMGEWADLVLRRPS